MCLEFRLNRRLEDILSGRVFLRCCPWFRPFFIFRFSFSLFFFFFFFVEFVNAAESKGKMKGCAAFSSKRDLLVEEESSNIVGRSCPMVPVSLTALCLELEGELFV